MIHRFKYSLVQTMPICLKKLAVCLPLKHIFGFAEHYRQVIVNMKQELVLIRSRTDLDCYNGEADGRITLRKIQWKVPHLTLSDRSKLKLFERINRNPIITIPFRQWELHEYPSLKQVKMDIWPIKTSAHLEKPRWVIVALQKNQRRRAKNDRATVFDHANISDIRLHLNSERYPYEAMNLDFTTNKYAIAYRNYVNFQCNYYDRNDWGIGGSTAGGGGNVTSAISMPTFDYTEFKECPIFVIDCASQNENLKNSTVDVKLELESNNNFENGMVAYCLIIHDAIVQYNPLTGEVKRL
ncbi:hypothetical protein RN001_001889 [Aquatica leii]|uniref:Double jelly roll-like domain-containing protein n=1 Tax=Aquatica leii TaxID=1421715 RepID=A0AAN7QN53_9COLE|nr:hypothetical protein RN001_001889 [Aquatica leii]